MENIITIQTLCYVVLFSLLIYIALEIYGRVTHIYHVKTRKRSKVHRNDEEPILTVTDEAWANHIRENNRATFNTARLSRYSMVKRNRV